MEKEPGRFAKGAVAVYRAAFAQVVAPAARRRLVVRGSCLALAAAVAYTLWPARDPKGVRYLIAQRDVPSGAPVTSLHFGMVSKSEAPPEVPPDAVTDQELHLLKGSLVNLPLRRGELLRRGHLKVSPSPKSLSESIPLGSRAYLLEDPAAAKVRAGDRIDLNFVEAGNPAKVFSLGENLLVLDTNRRDEMTLAVSVEDLETIELSRSRGRIGVVVRNPRESQRGRNGRKPRFAGKVSKRERIAIIYEGDE